MADMLKVARLFFVLLVLVIVGRFLMGTSGVPYEKGHHVFSVVILTVFSCLYYGAFTRRWLDYRLIQAGMLGVIFGLAGQVLIVIVTVVSYVGGLQTYFNHPTALNQPEAVSFGQAMGIRASGLVANTIAAGVIACLGWALGGLLPKKQS
jgi:hypothetical protein